MTPTNRSQTYVSVVAKELGDKVHLNKEVASIQRKLNEKSGRYSITVTDQHGNNSEFDSVVFACHPDQALRILGQNASANETKWLSSFKYAVNDTYLHSDQTLMPKNPDAWTSWNYIGTESSKSAEVSRPVFVTYWLNKLQNLDHPRNIFVSLNPTRLPDPQKTFQCIKYAHPQYSLDAVKAQRGVACMQGELATYFCGAWMGFGFHEDGFRSGIEVAMAISGVPVPWVAKWGQQKMIPAPKMALLRTKHKASFSNVIYTLFRPLQWSMEIVFQRSVLSFFNKSFEKGKLTIILPNKQIVTYTGKNPNSAGEDVSIAVHSNWFFVRLALEADIGLAQSYICGEWEIVNTGPHSDGLTRFLQLLIDQMPNGKTKTSGGLDVSNMLSAWFGSAFNALWFHMTMDNTIVNSRSNIHAVSLFTLARLQSDIFP